MRAWMVTAAAVAVASGAQAASKEIQYGPAPAWTGSAPVATGTAPSDGAAVQMIYADTQVRLGADGDEYYTAYRVKILRPEALALGNLSAVWNPTTDDLRVHGLKIYRDGQVIDVLAANQFKVIQREDNLESAMLNGDLTAMLQAPGLQVGDELEFAATVTRRDPVLGDRAQGGLFLPPTGQPGAYRLRLSWPKAKSVRWRATPDVGALKPVEAGGFQTLTYELRDPASAVTAEGAPARVNLRRFIEYTGFSSWAEVSHLLQPLYDKAAILAPDSPIKAEAAKIAAATSDPAARAEAALKLVQERIRYVYVGMDGANYRPAGADETWTRRFGDCKAKSVLLLALLRELGVPAEAMLVHSQGADGADQRLPMLAVFDHVVVRAKVGGQAYWLDGTRLGDTRLELLPPTPYRWGLPVRAGAVELERVEPQAPQLVEDGTLLEIDAREGFDAPSKVSAEEILRGDLALQFKVALGQMSKADADRFLKQYWAEQYDWVEPETAGWRYDELQNATVLTMEGEGETDWDGDAEEGRRLDIAAAGFVAPDRFRRAKEQDQAAPWVITYPSYKRWTTVVRLPAEADGWKWAYRAPYVDQQFGGVAYRRDAELHDGLLRITRSRRALAPEITADEAAAANKALAKFDDKVARLYQYKETSEAEKAARLVKMEADAAGDAQKLAAMGGGLAGLKKYDEALRVLDKALALEPTLVMALATKAEVLARRDDFDGALRTLDAAGKADSLQIGMQRVQILSRAGRSDAARAAVDALFAAHPDDADVLAAYAGRANDADRRARALAAVDAAIKRNPVDVTLRQVRAQLYGVEGRWAEALADLEVTVRVEPEALVNLRNRAGALQRLGRTQEAMRDIDEALRINPLDEGSVAVKGGILRAEGRPRDEVALLTQAVERSRTATNLNNRCWARGLSDIELAEAEADCAEAVKLEPKAAGFWDSYAMIALRAGKLDEALRRYDQALTLSPKLAPSLYGRGLVKLRKGDAAGGKADIAAAEAVSPKAGEELNRAGLKP